MSKKDLIDFKAGEKKFRPSNRNQETEKGVINKKY